MPEYRLEDKIQGIEVEFRVKGSRDDTEKVQELFKKFKEHTRQVKKEMLLEKPLNEFGGGNNE